MAPALDFAPPSPARNIDWTGPLPSRYLLAGELYAGDEACVVNTVLGSCVAVTMLHAGAGLAAICHAMLPEPRSAAEATPGSPAGYKYVSMVIPAMFDFFARRGVGPRHLEVKVFGGANVLQQPSEPWIGTGVGQANINMARVMLGAAQVRVHVSDIGGPAGRRILFNTLSGRVLLKYLDCSANRAGTLAR